MDGSIIERNGVIQKPHGLNHVNGNPCNTPTIYYVLLWFLENSFGDKYLFVYTLLPSFFIIKKKINPVSHVFFCREITSAPIFVLPLKPFDCVQKAFNKFSKKKKEIGVFLFFLIL